MHRTRPLPDGLWRCLCPAFDEHISRRVVNASFPVQATASPLGHNRPVPSISSTQRRQHGTTAIRNQESFHRTQSLDSFFAQIGKLKAAKPKAVRSKKKFDIGTMLQNAPAGDIVKTLRTLRGGTSKGLEAHRKIVQLVQLLIQKRGHRPDAFIYECMMDAMVDTQGSAAGVHNLLQEMLDNGIAPTAEICQSALQALTVHPDYVIRQQVLDFMQKYWYTIDKPANQNIAIGMLRDGQHELALAKFTEMHESNEKIDLWVYDIFIVEFGRVGFLDEMLQLLRQRKHAKGTDNAFRILLLHALEIFSKSYHEAGTKFVWEYVVAQPILNPPTAILENVLGTAARHADTTLATEALNILSSRGRVPVHQNEALLDAFAACEDMAGAFGVLAIMERNGAEIERATTRSIYLAMKKNPWLISEANTALEEMSKDGRAPLEAVLVTIEATARVRGSEVAMPLYDETFSMTGQRPGLGIIKDLILNCANEETIVTLTRDYGAISSHNEWSHGEEVALFDRMIIACANMGDFDRAFELAERIIKAEDLVDGGQAWHSRQWVVPLIERGVGAQDSRVWPIVDEVIKRGNEDAEKVQSILRRQQLGWRLEEWKSRKNQEHSLLGQASKAPPNEVE